MRKTDVFIFADMALLVVDAHAGDGRVHLRTIAGPADVPRKQVIHSSMLQGRPTYRLVSAVDDVDLDHAVEEVQNELDVSDFVDDPRRWTDAFVRQHGSRTTPDMTIMMGWFATAIEAGRAAGRREAQLARKRPTPAKKKGPAKRAGGGKTAAKRPGIPVPSTGAMEKAMGRIPKVRRLQAPTVPVALTD